jgi:hypothetical protein
MGHRLGKEDLLSLRKYLSVLVRLDWADDPGVAMGWENIIQKHTKCNGMILEREELTEPSN